MIIVQKQFSVVLVAVLLLPIFSSFFVCVDADSTLWYDSDFLYRNVYYVNSTLVDEELNDFPVLVYLNSSYVDWSLIQDDLDDLRFVDSSDDLLFYEIDSYSVNNWSYIWVSLPVVSAVSDTKFFMYYGCPSGESGESGSDVWGSDYSMVLHMNDISDSQLFATVVYDDADASFWSSTTNGAGSIGVPVISNSTDVVVEGDISVNVTVGAGAGQYWIFYHTYGSPVDWSSYGCLSFWFYGYNSGTTMRLILYSGDGGFYFDWSDSYSGWKHIVVPFELMSEWGSTNNFNSISEINFRDATGNHQGVWYLDYVTLGYGCVFDSTENHDVFKRGLNEPDEVEVLVGNSQLYDGDDDYMDVYDYGSHTDSVGTVQAWINFTTLNSQNIIFSYFDSWDNYTMLYVASGGNLYMRIRIGAVTVDNQIAYVGSVVANSVHHVAVVADGVNVTGYVDGVKQVSVAETDWFDSMLTAGSDIKVGAMQTFSEPDGIIDELRLSSVNCSESWMKADFYSQSLGLTWLSEVEDFFGYGFSPRVVSVGFVVAVMFVGVVLVFAVIFIYTKRR